MGDGASSSRRGVGRRGGQTVVVDHGRRRSSCGYCRSTGCTSISHGLSLLSIKADDYQDLLDRGWRRSGCFLYKPEMERTCCPSYTIRLKACDFVPSKEQIRVQKRMQRFLDGTLVLRNANQIGEMNSTKCHSFEKVPSATGSSISVGESSCRRNEAHKEEDLLLVLSKVVDDAVSACTEMGDFPSIEPPKAVVKKVKPQSKRKLFEDLLYTSNISFQIAALLKRTQPAQENNFTACFSVASQLSMDASPTSVAEKLASSIKWNGESLGLYVKACNGHLNFCSSTSQSNTFQASNDEKCKETSEDKSEKKTCHPDGSSTNVPYKKQKLEIRMKRSAFDPEEFALYKRYQIIVHGEKPEKVTEFSYKRFLVDTPIIYIPPSSETRGVPPCGFGSFHQQYVIDGKLVAVGVVDILPRCLSSKYLFWDPDFAFLSLGKYSALQEISWVKDASLHCPSLNFYYLGYYIHSCRKMRYKAAYHPSELLCPLRYEWVPFDIAKPLLDRKPYVVLSDFATQLHAGSSPPLPFISNGTSSSLLSAAMREDHRDEIEEAVTYHEFLYEDENDKSDSDDSDEPPICEISSFDVSNILIDLNGSRLRFKDLQRLSGHIDRRFVHHLELQLKRYARVVGNELCSRMVYSLG